MRLAQLTLLVVAATGLVLSGCSGTGEPQPIKTQSLELSWADGASSKDELIKQAEAIIVGTVESTEVTEVTDFGPLSDATISVNTWVKSQGEKPETIVIRQTGGESDGVLYQAADDPLLQVGEKGIFFVRYDANTGVYIILGGPTGRFKVIGNDAQPLPGTAIQGFTSQKVAQLIEEAKGH